MKHEVIRDGVRIRISPHIGPQERASLSGTQDHVYLLIARAYGGACCVREGHLRDSLRRAGLMVPCIPDHQHYRGQAKHHWMALTKAGQKRADAIFAARHDALGMHNFRKWMRRDRNRVVQAKTPATRYPNNRRIR